MAELETLSKLKLAGKLHFWRGTIEIPEDELHAICDEIQAEYDHAISALNKAAGNWARADAELRELLKDYAFALRRLEYDVDKPGSNMTLGEYEAEEKRVTDEYAQAIAATLGNPINEATGKPFDFNKLANRLNGDKDATIGNGTLTAEQVREAIERHSAWVIGNNRCFHDGAYEEIADELNATLMGDAE